MDKRNNIEKKVEETMDSLDNIRRAAANPFIFTRIQARLQSKRSAWDQVASLTGKPAFAIMLLSIVLLTNLTVMMRDTPVSPIAEQYSQAGIVDEYAGTESGLYEEENPEP